MEEVERYPVLSQAEPGSVRAKLPEAAPERGEPFADVLRDVDEIIVPGITHWQSPNFYAYFPANASGPSILGDLLSSGLGVQGMLWATSPALHRDRDPRARLAGGPAGAAAGISFQRSRRRGNPGQRVEQHADRADCGSVSA